jgi:hypothetical protein
MSKDEIQALKERMKNKQQSWTDAAAKPEVRSVFGPMTPKLIAKPDKPEVAPKPVPSDIPNAAALAPLKLAPARVDIYLEVQSRPQHQGLGAVYPTSKKDGARAVYVDLFRERPVVEQALARGDLTGLRFLASLLLIEWLLRSGSAKTADIAELWKEMVIRLGGPFPFWTNVSFWACQLAGHELTAKIEGVGEKAILWFSVVGAKLPTPSRMWQWNKDLAKPEKKPKQAATPQGEIK